MFNWIARKQPKSTAALPDETVCRRWHAEANEAVALGHWQAAIDLFQKLVEARPKDASAWYGLGNALYQHDRLENAKSALQRSVELNDKDALAHYKLGNVLKDLRQPDDAMAQYRQAISLNPTFAEALNNLGMILETQGCIDDALAAYRKSVQANPALVPACRNLAFLLGLMGNHREAIAAAEKFIQLAPAQDESWEILALSHNAAGEPQKALEVLRAGLREIPNSATLLNTVGKIYENQHLLDDACASYQRAVISSPTSALSRTNLANLYLQRGEIDRAIDTFREAIALDPQNAEAARLLLMALLYSELPNETFFKEHLAFGRFGANHRHFQHNISAPMPANRRLRIGYISSDFHHHPVTFNLKPVLEKQDRSKFEIFLYADIDRPDEMSEWLQQHCDKWFLIHHLSDEAVAQRVYSDNIDILVFLAGRFDRNRPLVATFKPAPIQVSMHDAATSGLTEMDYLVADRNLDPRTSTEKFMERVVHLPTFYLHAPISGSPNPGNPPACQRGYITFGSFNNPAKLNRRIISLWARILQSTPRSKLFLKYWGIFTTQSVRDRFLAWFQEEGIPEERVILNTAAASRHSHLSLYSEIDICLDPFPFTGSTTTFESLWMGVPVVSLAGDRMVSRWSSAMLKKVGLDQLIANNEEQYKQIATSLAENLEHLILLRSTLRECVEASALCAAKRRARQLERLYQWMWQKYIHSSLTNNRNNDA